MCYARSVVFQENPMTTATLGFFAGSNLRRAPKAAVSQSTVRAVDPYAECMACWVDYMRMPNLDLTPRGMKLVGDALPDVDVHDAQYIADLRMGEAVNAMVDSLVMIHRWAIYKSQGIASAWRFSNARYEDVLMEARDELEKKLRTNVATRLYWA
jgi:hypothetical protein